MYYIFYNAKTKPATEKGHVNWFEQTGMAMSKDLQTWKRIPNNPIIRNGRAPHGMRTSPATLVFSNSKAMGLLLLRTEQHRWRSTRAACHFE